SFLLLILSRIHTLMTGKTASLSPGLVQPHSDSSLKPARLRSVQYTPRGPICTEPLCLSSRTLFPNVEYLWVV
uniref:Ig-like domain-containing protein n=1 Tax=Hippocampus comes TaxID=109280 RepID=A0A3Q3D3K6_HIPCM